MVQSAAADRRLDLSFVDATTNGSTDEYYLRVTAPDADEYRLVVTRGGSLEPAEEVTPSEVPIGVGGVVLGKLDANVFSRLFSLDEQDRSIVELDPATGSEVQRVSLPVEVDSPVTGLAFDGVSLFVHDESNSLYEVDPDTGEFIDEDFLGELRLNLSPTRGAAAVDGTVAVSGDQLSRSNVVVYVDPSTGSAVGDLLVLPVPPTAESGVAASPSSLFLTEALAGSSLVREFDIATGGIINEITVPDIGGGASFVNGKLFLTDSTGGSILIVDPSTGDVEGSFSTSFNATSLGGTSVSVGTDPVDVYSFSVTAGDELSIATATPGGGEREPLNTLNPRLELIDPLGDVVAADDNGGSDGRNASLSYTAAMTGTYTVRVTGLGAGDYQLTVAGNTGPSLTGVQTQSSEVFRSGLKPSNRSAQTETASRPEAVGLISQSVSSRSVAGAVEGSVATPQGAQVATFGDSVITTAEGESGQDVVVFFQLQAGGFGTGARLTPSFAGQVSLVVEDFNADGASDLAIVGTGPESSLEPRLYIDTHRFADGDFEVRTSHSVLETSLSTQTPRVRSGDLDRDGTMDLAIVGQMAGGAEGFSIEIARGRGDGTFSEEPGMQPVISVSGATALDVHAGYLDSDSRD